MCCNKTLQQVLFLKIIPHDTRYQLCIFWCPWVQHFNLFNKKHTLQKRCFAILILTVWRQLSRTNVWKQWYCWLLLLGSVWFQWCLSNHLSTFSTMTMLVTLGPLYKYGFLILAWICNHMPCKVWDEITYPFPNFNSCTVEVWEWISNFISLYNGCNYLSMLGLKLINISKRGAMGLFD